MHACTTCLTGSHLPAFAAEGGGLFAEQDLDVDVVTKRRSPPATPVNAHSLSYLARRLDELADGEVDFALIPVAYVLSAKHESDGELPVRFAACFHQRYPTAAVVARDSGVETAASLAGRRASRRTLPWLVQEYAAALEHHGVGPAEIVEAPGKADPVGALARGELDVVPIWMDLYAYFSGSEIPLRVIPLDVDVYCTGLVAGDHVPLELVERMRDAVEGGFHLQLEQPDVGIEAFTHRFPYVDTDHIRRSWSLFEPYAFDGATRPGAMDAERWRSTMEYLAATHGLSVFPLEEICREEFLTGAVAKTGAPS